MLTTRCPDCQTVFRITAAALHKADGQVRCGQCATVFSAFDSLMDTLTDLPDELVNATYTNAEMGAISEAETLDPAPISEQQVDEVLETAADVPPAPWMLLERPPKAKLVSPFWGIASMLAIAALAIQGIHHFRSDLVKLPYVGGPLDRAYGLLGSTIEPSWNPSDFTITEWVATAQTADADAVGSLLISAGIKNLSDEPRPYPLLRLNLTDRWEESIGSRVFYPNEYTGSQLSASARIRSGATIAAKLELVDPGPNAYGFEVDVCVEANANNIRCKSDIAFE